MTQPALADPNIPEKVNVSVCKIKLRFGGHGDVKHIYNRCPNRLKARVDNIEFPLEPGWNLVPSFIVPFDRTPETGKPLDMRRHERLNVPRSSLVEGMLSRGNLARDHERVITEGFD